MIGTTSFVDALLPKAAISIDTFRIAGYEPPNPPEPLSEEHIQTKVARYRNELKGRWPAFQADLPPQSMKSSGPPTRLGIIAITNIIGAYQFVESYVD